MNNDTGNTLLSTALNTLIVVVKTLTE